MVQSGRKVSVMIMNAGVEFKAFTGRKCGFLMRVTKYNFAHF